MYLFVLSVNHKMNIQKCIKYFRSRMCNLGQCWLCVGLVRMKKKKKYAKMTIAERKAAAAREQKIP